MKSWFWIDIFCCIPLDLVIGAYLNSNQVDSTNGTSTTVQNSQYNLVKLAKLPRIYRLLKVTKVVKMVKFLSSDSSLLQSVQISSGMMRLINLLTLVFIVVHLIGCLWYYQAKIDDFNELTWVYRLKLLDASDLTLYLYSVYFVLTTITTVGFGDITPYSTSDIFYLFCNANIFSNSRDNYYPHTYCHWSGVILLNDWYSKFSDQVHGLEAAASFKENHDHE